MESNKLDTFFKDKIDRHTEQVSADAWKQLQAKLPVNKKAKKPIWMFMAASISIILCSTIIIFTYRNTISLNEYPISKIDINNAATDLTAVYSFNNNVPTAIQEKTEHSQLNKAAYTDKSSQSDDNVVNRGNLPVERINIRLPKITYNPLALKNDKMPSYTVNFKRIESDIKVNMNYTAQETDKLDELKQTTQRIKSLASEITLADLRSAKNELFASALSFEKKHIN